MTSQETNLLHCWFTYKQSVTCAKSHSFLSCEFNVEIENNAVSIKHLWAYTKLSGLWGASGCIHSCWTAQLLCGLALNTWLCCLHTQQTQPETLSSNLRPQYIKNCGVLTPCTKLSALTESNELITQNKALSRFPTVTSKPALNWFIFAVFCVRILDLKFSHLSCWLVSQKDIFQ